MNEYLIICYFICLIYIFIASKRFNLKISNIIVFFPFLLFIAFSKSPDTQAYRSFFILADYNLSNIQGTEFAIGFQILTKIIKLVVGSSFEMYMFLITLLNILIVIYSLNVLLKNTILNEQVEFFKFDILLALMMYFAYFGIYYNGIAIRANFAITTIYLILAIIGNGKYNLFKILSIIGLFCLASLFHTSAIIGVFVILIFYLSGRFSQVTYVLLLIIIGAFYFSGLSKTIVHDFLNLNIFEFILNSFYNDGIAEIDRYSRNVEIIDQISIKFIFQYVVSFILIFPKSQPAIYYKYLNIYFAGIIIYGILGSMQVLTRVQDFFSFSLFILSWLYIRKINSISLSVISCLVIILPQLFFILRIFNKY